MEFLCFIFCVAALIIGLVVWNSKRVDNAWGEAAAALRMRFEKEGFNERTLFGDHAGFDIKMSTYWIPIAGKRTIFTGYHIALKKSLGLDLSIQRQKSGSGSFARGSRQDIVLGDPVFDPKVVISGSDESAIREFLDPDRRRVIYRLIKEFDEYELDGRAIHVAKKGVQANSTFLINNVNLLIQTVNQLGAYSPEVDDGESDVTPPPLPNRENIDPDTEIELAPAILEAAVIEEVEIAEAEVTAEAEVKTAKVNAPLEPEPQKEESQVELKAAIIAESVFVNEADSEEEETAEDEPIVDLAKDDTKPVTPVVAVDSEEFVSLCDELFKSGLGRFEAGKLFDSLLKGNTKSGVGTLKRVDKFYSDLVFGRGPGIAAQVDIETTDGEKAATAMVQLCPEEIDLAELKSQVGEPFEFSGKLLKCDLFTNRIYVGKSE